MTEPLKFWQRNAPDDAVAKHESRHGTKIAKAKDRMYGRDAGPRVDDVTKERAKGRTP